MRHTKKLPLLGRRAVLGAAGALLLPAPALRAQAPAGVALVIGNSKYQWEAQLPNVRRDVPDIAKRFQAMGLKTELLQDLGRDGMRQAIERFAAAARGANLTAFYFAGHGATWGKDTYLVPVDADLSNPSAVQTLLPATEINSSGASNRLAVLDACSYPGTSSAPVLAASPWARRVTSPPSANQRSRRLPH